MTDNLTAQELTMLLSIIDISSKGGMFTGADLLAVGSLYTRLTELAMAEKAEANKEALAAALVPAKPNNK